MMFPTTRREWLATALSGAFGACGIVRPAQAAAQPIGRPFRIYAITFRGQTSVERGFEDYFAARKFPVQITYRDLARDPTRMPGFLDEIRATKPDLVYTWGTSVTLGVVGPYDTPNRDKYINDIPVVFTLVASPQLAKIVVDKGPARPHITGVIHVAPTETQIQAIAAYRPFQTLGVLYTPTEKNSVVVLDDIRRLGRARGFDTVERMIRVDGNRQPTADGAAELVQEIKESRAQWLYLPPDSFLGTIAKDIVIPTAMSVGLPTFASTEQLMEAGALTGLVSRYYNVGQFTAHKCEQILAERRAPSSVPVEPLKRFSYQIRMAAAEKLRLPPPLGMFSYAELISDPLS